MNKQDEPASQPQPWHEADEQDGATKEPVVKRGAPVGTHSFTGNGAAVGIAGGSGPNAEKGRAADSARPQTLPVEPRAGGADLLGRRPGDPGR